MAVWFSVSGVCILRLDFYSMRPCIYPTVVAVAQNAQTLTSLPAGSKWLSLFHSSKVHELLVCPNYHQEITFMDGVDCPVDKATYDMPLQAFWQICVQDDYRFL